MGDKIKSKYDRPFKQAYFWDRDTQTRRKSDPLSIRSILETPDSLHKDELLDAVRVVCIDMINYLDEQSQINEETKEFYSKYFDWIKESPGD